MLAAPDWETTKIFLSLKFSIEISTVVLSFRLISETDQAVNKPLFPSISRTGSKQRTKQ